MGGAVIYKERTTQLSHKSESLRYREKETARQDDRMGENPASCRERRCLLILPLPAAEFKVAF
jgi:hypothetical protein